MKKILVLYGSYGGGHVSAAKAIYNNILENHKDVEVKLLDCIENTSKYFNIVSTKTYTRIAKSAPWAWGKIYKHSNSGSLYRLTTNSNKLMAIKFNLYLKEYAPDIIISTHPFSSAICSYLKKKNKLQCKVVTVLTDFEIHNQWLVNQKYMNDYFVSTDEMKKEMVNLGINYKKIFVTGIPVSERFTETFNKNKIYE